MLDNGEIVLGEEPEDYSKKLQELYENFSRKEREVLNKILSDEEERLWVDIEKKWINKLKIFTNVDAIRQMMGLEYQEKKRMTYYSSGNIPWLIHQYWDQPKKYLKERLKYTRSAQSFMLNIYYAILITVGIGLWIFCLTKLIEYVPKMRAFWTRPLNYIFEIIPFVCVAIIFFGGLTLLLIPHKKIRDLRRSIISGIRKKFIIGSLNMIDIESYIITKILEERKEQEETRKKENP